MSNLYEILSNEKFKVFHLFLIALHTQHARKRKSKFNIFEGKHRKLKNIVFQLRKKTINHVENLFG